MMFKKILFIILLLSFISCESTLDLFDGGINNVTIGHDGQTSFNPSVGPITNPPTGTTNPPTGTTNPPTGTTNPPTGKTNPPTGTRGETSKPPSLPTTTSILDGLPALTKSFFFTEREAAGMPRVNGERIEADLYGTNILIIRYSTNLIKIRYSQDISNIDQLGQVQDQSARVAYPTSFIKIFFQDTNGDTAVKIFGIVEVQ